MHLVAPDILAEGQGLSLPVCAAGLGSGAGRVRPSLCRHKPPQRGRRQGPIRHRVGPARPGGIDPDPANPRREAQGGLKGTLHIYSPGCTFNAATMTFERHSQGVAQNANAFCSCLNTLNR